MTGHRHTSVHKPLEKQKNLPGLWEGKWVWRGEGGRSNSGKTGIKIIKIDGNKVHLTGFAQGSGAAPSTDMVKGSLKKSALLLWWPAAAGGTGAGAAASGQGSGGSPPGHQGDGKRPGCPAHYLWDECRRGGGGGYQIRKRLPHHKGQEPRTGT